jgi:transcriptional regulator with XRE-family HTH domain
MSAPWYAPELADARIEQGLTVAQLASRIHYSESIITHWENGTARPSVEALATWADALGFQVGLYLACPVGVAKTLPPSTEQLFQELISALAQLFDDDVEEALDQEAA